MTDHRPSYEPNSPRVGHRVESDVVDRGQEQMRSAMRRLVIDALAHAPDKVLKTAMTEVCRVAHREEISVERMLIALRAEWESADKPNGRRWDALDAIRANLVSHCIKQFYETRA